MRFAERRSVNVALELGLAILISLMTVWGFASAAEWMDGDPLSPPAPAPRLRTGLVDGNNSP